MAKETETLKGQTLGVLEPEDRARDTYGDGRSLRFITSEHDEMTMPQAFEVRDAEGRWAVYVTPEIDGKIVRPQPQKTPRSSQAGTAPETGGILLSASLCRECGG
jgi:hypothetical protein